MARTIAWIAVLLCLCAAPSLAQGPLSVVTGSLPALSAGMDFHFFLQARGAAPPYVWSIASGDLPEGLTLTPEGCLCGRPTKTGDFEVTLKVEDSGHPAHSATKDFHFSVAAALLLEWLEQPKVSDSRIDGSVQVSNGTPDSFDLTVVIVAVASSNQRATAIGYQHFELQPKTTNVPITFGNTLPHGEYVIHVDAIAEIPARNSILRQRLETPKALQIVTTP